MNEFTLSHPPPREAKNEETTRVLTAALLTITMATEGFPAAALAEETDTTSEASAQQETTTNDEGTAGEPSVDNGTKNAAEGEQATGADNAAKQPGPGPKTASPESAAANLPPNPTKTQ